MSATTILILIATERVSGPLKGIFQYLRHLDRQRYRPVLGLLRARRTGPSDAEREATAQGIPFDILEQSGPFDWRLIDRARRLADKHAASLVQTHGYKTHLLGFLLQQRCGLRWLGFEHGWTAENWRIRLYHRLDWLLRYADGVIVVSEELRGQLRRMGVPAARLTCIHNAVEPDEGWSRCLPGQFRRANQIPADVPLVTVIGRITRDKGLRVFLEAFRRLRPSAPNAHVAIVGEGIDGDNVRARSRDLGLSDAVHFAEWQRPITSVYVDTDVIAIPSIAFEGVPNVLLEAMAAERPVVASDVGGISEVVTNEEGALLVPPSDPGALADAIGRLLGDKQLRDRIVAEARRRILVNHCPMRRAQQIRKLYDALFPV